VLTDCKAMIEPQTLRSDIRLSFPQAAGGLFVSADRTRLKQVLVNLLSNAIKYNRPGGLVEVTCSATTATRTRISCRDTGAGLSPEQLGQLFQPFNRLGQEAGGTEGTGIGLVVSKRLVELMGGEIAATSTIGVGSVFWIELNSTVALQPPAGLAEPAPVAGMPAETDLRVRTVLCVEDNPANLMLVANVLARRPDIRLLTARDGNSGVELARVSRPDVILMDLNLPGISGIEALQILAKDPLTAHIPVIALSANAMPRDIEKGMKAGFFRYLTKPIEVPQFMATLDIALNRSITVAAQTDQNSARATVAG
jgi:CheY-like chemotaxis protein